MYRFPLDSESSFLILAPRWADFGAAWQIVLLALLFVVPMALILSLYRYELRLISRWHALGLVPLRLAILIVLWVVIGLQPHWVEEHIEETPGRVRVAVDLSSSMEVVDYQSTPAEKAALAKALNFEGTGELPARRAIVARMLSADGLNLLKRLADRHEIEIVGFGEKRFELTPPQLTEKLKGDASKEIVATDVRHGLDRVTTNRQSPLLGVVLFSDGQHNVGDMPLARADDFGLQKIPIYPVAIGSREPPSDAMILDVQAPSKVFRNTTLPVEIRCKVTNLRAQDLTVELQFDGKPVQPEHRQTVVHKGKDDVYSVRFQPKMEKAGTRALTAKITSKGQKEATLANNARTRIVRVAEDKVKVLLVDGDARWEYHYLANALPRDEAIALDRVVFSQPRIGLLKDDQLEKAGLPKSKLPEPAAERKEVDPLLAYDCIILGDASPEQLPLADRRRLEKFVGERGGTLILSAGKRHLPLAFAKDGDDPLTRMLPILSPAELKRDDGFGLRVTSDGKARPFLSLSDEAGVNIWAELPKHYWAIAGKRKPAASVLVAAADEKDPDTGIIVQQNYGFGKVVLVGIDSTWRWRFRVGDAYHHRFWGQLARWSAGEKLLPAGNRHLRYGSREPVYEEGEKVELSVRLSETLPPLKDASKARAKLHRKKVDGTEEHIADVALMVNPRQPNILDAAFPSLAHGTYRIELDIPQYRAELAEPPDEKHLPAKDGDLFRVLPREQKELLDLSTNWSLLQGLADRSGGKLYTPATVDEVVESLARRIERKESREETKPWQDEPTVWWLLGILLGLLTLEWVWRKLVELP